MGYENSAGLSVRNHYGPRSINETFGGELSTSGLVKEIQAVYDLSTASFTVASGANTIVLGNPTGGGELEAVIPAYATIKSARAEVVEALASTNMSAATAVALLVGLDKYSDGTAIDADGLIDATDGALTLSANDIVHAVGDQFVGSNAALVPNVDIGAAAGQLYAAISIDNDTGLATLSGKIRVVVEYVDNRSDGSSRYTAGGVKG